MDHFSKKEKEKQVTDPVNQNKSQGSLLISIYEILYIPTC